MCAQCRRRARGRGVLSAFLYDREPVPRFKKGDQQGRKVLLGDPMEIALVETAERFVSALPDWKKLDEIPFDVSRMRLSTVHATPQGPTLFCKGAPEMVVPLCDRILADGEIRPLDSGLRTKVRQAQEAMAGQGLRVIAMSYRPLEDHWEDGKRLRDADIDPPRFRLRPVRGIGGQRVLNW
jgi:sodium/potassium-transporting ATPase subunit alpha